MKNTTICIILARGGSKRIPLKNIVELNGYPLISWPIKSALKSNVFDKVVVSTDSEQIANVARAYGAEVPFLRRNYFDDNATASSATINALSQAEEYFNKKWSNVAQMMGNCPMVTSDNIQYMQNNYTLNKISSQISCFKYGWMNPWWACKLTSDGKPKPIFEKKQGQRSQDLEELYCPSGALWIADSSKLKKYGTFYMPDHKMVEIPWKNAVDIDNYEDLEMAHLLANQLNM